MTSWWTAFRGYLSYRGREGLLAFLLHRISGLGTLLFLIIHILDTALVYFAPDLYAEIIGLYRSTLFGIGEIGLVFCVLFHGVNGLRIAIFDLWAPRFWKIPEQRNSVWITLVVAVVLWLPAAAIMVKNLLTHNFGLFGG